MEEFKACITGLYRYTPVTRDFGRAIHFIEKVGFSQVRMCDHVKHAKARGSGGMST